MPNQHDNDDPDLHALQPLEQRMLFPLTSLTNAPDRPRHEDAVTQWLAAQSVGRHLSMLERE